MIRHAFDAWQYNSETVFYETRNTSGADVVIGTEWMDDRQWIALARWHTSADGKGEIRVGIDTCWYTDRHFCHAVNRDMLFLSIFMGLTWGIFVCLALYNLRSRPIPFVSIPRLLMWVIVLSIPALSLGSLYPCIICHDFTAVVIHEIGHILGFGHSDTDAPQTCGCGGVAQRCATNHSSETLSVMHSMAQRRDTLCLSRDDVDAVRSIYGGVCDDPVWCYESPSTTGYTRVSTAMLYSFAAASLIVFVRNRFLGRRYKQQIPHVTHPRTSTQVPHKRDPHMGTTRHGTIASIHRI